MCVDFLFLSLLKLEREGARNFVLVRICGFNGNTKYIEMRVTHLGNYKALGSWLR